MQYFPKSALIGVALLAGVAMTAHAQSVANLPPAGSTGGTATAPVSVPPVAGPNPGSNIGIPGTAHYQKPTDWDSNAAYHPYSTSGAGPNPGSNVSANNEPTRPAPGSDTQASHPYSQGGTGPSPGANINIPNSH